MVLFYHLDQLCFVLYKVFQNQFVKLFPNISFCIIFLLEILVEPQIDQKYVIFMVLLDSIPWKLEKNVVNLRDNWCTSELVMFIQFAKINSLEFISINTFHVREHCLKKHIFAVQIPKTLVGTGSYFMKQWKMEVNYWNSVLTQNHLMKTFKSWFFLLRVWARCAESNKTWFWCE